MRLQPTGKMDSPAEAIFKAVIRFQIEMIAMSASDEARSGLDRVIT
jgi:hypothetical protein